MKKRIKLVLPLIVLAFLISTTNVYAEDGRYSGSYAMIPSGFPASMGQYEPGTYIIASSSIPDAGSMILDELNGICSIPLIGDKIPGCEYVEWGNRLIKIMPDARFIVELRDADNPSDVIWSGELTSGKDDLYLGDDHRLYDVRLQSKTLGTTYFVQLVRK